MGNKKSTPSAEIKGDKDTVIINTQELHSEHHEQHELKLWLILCLVSIQVMYLGYKILQKRIKRKTLQLAKSLNQLDTV